MSLAAVAMIAFWAFPVQAQSPPVTAEVDRSELALGDTLILTVSVGGTVNISLPTLPTLDGLLFVGRSSSTEFRTVNGRTSGSVSHQYTFRAIEVGSIRIGPVRVVVDGRPYETDPITVEVTQVPARPRSVSPDDDQDAPAAELVGQRRFVEASVDDSTPYLGGQVVYSVRYYQAAEPFELGHFFRVRPGRPNFAGFWDGQYSEERRYEAEVAGRRYRVWEERSIVFPTVVGQVTIQPVKVAVPGGFFERDADLRTQPVSLTVRPLPDGAPREFTGAVGQYEVTAGVDANSGTVGVPVTLTVTIAGTGNIDTAPEPVWPDLSDWRSFESTVSTSSRLDRGRIRGTRTYQRVMVPDRAGPLTIPAIVYAYFDPEAGEYRTAVTSPIAVDVRPAPAAAAPVNGVGDLSVPLDARVSDIRHIKPASQALDSGGSDFAGGPAYWALWALPLALLVASEAWRRRVVRSMGDPSAVRSSLAYQSAIDAIDGAARDQSDLFDAGHRILLGYVSDKLGQPIGGLTHASLAELLRRHGIEDSLADRVNSYVLDSEAGRFGPGAGSSDAGERALDDLVDLMGELEKALHR